jgi:trehalose 6-phosphate synthase
MQVVRDTDVGIWRDDFVASLSASRRPADGDGKHIAANAA